IRVDLVTGADVCSSDLPMSAREPGPIGAALEEERAYYGLIVDGQHVAPAMLRLALRGAGQAMLVSDAMPPVGGTADRFALAGKRSEERRVGAGYVDERT